MNGDVQEALASFRRSSAMLQELEKADPHNVLYHLDVAGATASVGRALAGAGKDAEGLAMLKRAVGVLEENHARDRSYTDIPYWLGQDHIWRGEILARMGTARAALDEYRRGASSLESLMSGTVSPDTRCDIAASYAKVGAGYTALRSGSEASAAYRKALEIAEPLVSSKPTNVLGLYAAADAYFGMGELAKSAAQPSTSALQGEEQQHWREACDWYRKSVDAWRQIPNPGRTTPSGFATLDPTTLARSLRACDAMLPGSEQPEK